MDFYKGIKQLYPKVPLPQKIRGFVALMRPFTILAAVVAGFSLNYFFAMLSGRGTTIVFSVLVGLVLGLLQSGGQALNQSLLVEMEIDKVNKKNYRPTLRGIVTFEEGKIFAFFLFLAGISLAFVLHSSCGFFAVLITLFAISYSAPPFRVKEKFFLNNFHQGIARGFLPALYVASAYGYGVYAELFGLVLAVWVIGAQTTKDFSDVKGDREFGVMTFPVKLGKTKALCLMSLFMGASFLLLNTLIHIGAFPRLFLYLNLLTLPSLAIVYALHKDLKLKRWENNLGWLLWYFTLALWYLLPAILI